MGLLRTQARPGSSSSVARGIGQTPDDGSSASTGGATATNTVTANGMSALTAGVAAAYIPSIVEPRSGSRPACACLIADRARRGSGKSSQYW